MYEEIMLVICFVAGFNGAREQKDNEIGPRIIHGTEAEDGEFPYVVSIAYGSMLHICGGSLLSTIWILTAAHCFYEPDSSDILSVSGFNIRVGVHYLFKRGDFEQDSRAQAIFPHPEYKSDENDYDVGLIMTVRPFTFSERVRSVPLPKFGTSDTLDNENCVTMGWGKNSEDSPTGTPTLLKINVSILARKKCSDMLKPFKVNFRIEDMICGSPRNIAGGICHGDSGGPLVCRETLVGSVSWGIGCASMYSPEVYMATESFRPWIESTMDANRMAERDANDNGEKVGMLPKASTIIFITNLLLLFFN